MQQLGVTEVVPETIAPRLSKLTAPFRRLVTAATFREVGPNLLAEPAAVRKQRHHFYPDR